jgi:hypothetical protein
MYEGDKASITLKANSALCFLACHLLRSIQYFFFQRIVYENNLFWDIRPYIPLKVNRRSRGTYRLHLQSRISRTRYEREDGSDIFFRNAGWFSTGYTAVYPRREYFTWARLWEPPIPRNCACASHISASVRSSHEDSVEMKTLEWLQKAATNMRGGILIFWINVELCNWEK